MSRNIFQRVAAKSRRKYRDASLAFQVRMSLQHVAGEKYINLPSGEVAVILLGRNMAHYLEHFHDYHGARGARYFVYVDNGSTDETIEIVSKWKNTVVVSTDLNFRQFETPIRQQISTTFCSEGWRLAIDPDELFDYVGSDKLSIPQLANSLRERGFTGLMAQMLDMVPDANLLDHSAVPFSESVERSIYFALDDISSFDYHDRDVEFSALINGNTLPDHRLTWKFGGLRKQYFGENCCLTKHPLFYMNKGVKPFRHPHLTTGLHLADFTALLRHYKFSGDYLVRESERLANNRMCYDETEKRAAVMGDGRGFRFDTSTMETDSSPLHLVDRGFLSMSDRAKKVYA